MRRRPPPIPPEGASPSVPLLTCEDVAARCAVSLRTVRAWIASGRLPVLRFGSRCVRVAPADLESLCREAREGRP